MTKHLGLYITVLVVTYCTLFPSLARSEPPKFPDRKSFHGISEVSVDMLSYENMSEIALVPADLIARVKTTLREAGIVVSNDNRLKGKKRKNGGKTGINTERLAILGTRLKRTEDSALFGTTKIGSVVVTMHLFQQVTVKHNHHSTHAITWSESLSVSGGSKRPKKILDALDKLVNMFVRDFTQNQSFSK